MGSPPEPESPVSLPSTDDPPVVVLADVDPPKVSSVAAVEVDPKPVEASLEVDAPTVSEAVAGIVDVGAVPAEVLPTESVSLTSIESSKQPATNTDPTTNRTVFA